MNDSYKEILIKRNTPVGNKILKGLLIALAAISIFIGLVFWPLLIVGDIDVAAVFVGDHAIEILIRQRRAGYRCYLLQTEAEKDGKL